MSTIFVLGPALENVIEPEPAPVPGSGRRAVAFRDLPTEPGGKVNLRLLPGADGDVAPINVYVFYCNPPSSVPAPEHRSPDWYFKSGVPSGQLATGHAPEEFDVVVTGVLPGAYHVGTVLEFQA